MCRTNPKTDSKGVEPELQRKKLPESNDQGWCSFKKYSKCWELKWQRNHHSQKVKPNLRSEPNQTNCQLKQKISTAPEVSQNNTQYVPDTIQNYSTNKEPRKHNRFFGEKTRDAKTKIKQILQLSKNFKAVIITMLHEVKVNTLEKQMFPKEKQKQWKETPNGWWWQFCSLTVGQLHDTTHDKIA